MRVADDDSPIPPRPKFYFKVFGGGKDVLTKQGAAHLSGCTSFLLALCFFIYLGCAVF